MPLYKIEFTKSAKREFDELPKKMKGKVIEALHFLSQNPFSELLQIKKLRNLEGLYRMRVGDYRILYEVRKEIVLIIVIKISHRKEVCRKLK